MTREHFETRAELGHRTEAVRQLRSASLASGVRAFARTADTVRRMVSVGCRLRPAELRLAWFDRQGLMTHRARSVVLGIICVFAAQQVQAQHALGDPIMVSPAVATPATASARAQERCTEAAVDVAAASSDHRRLVCSAASRAIERLGRCNIFLQRPLRIQILDEVRHPHHGGSIFGFFDTVQEVVLVTKYDNIPDLVRNTPYGEIRPLEFYKSLIVHEVVHAVMHQNLTRTATSNAHYEYPAYALQIESLPSDERDILLEATERGSDLDEFIFNDVILYFDSFFFAARAYEHFKTSANGCAHLLALLEGEVPFIQPPPLL